MPDPVPAEHTKLADRLDRSARLQVWAIIPIALIAVVDLSTGWLIDARRMDVALLAITAIALWGAYSMRRLAGRLRTGQVGRPTRRKWFLELASTAALLALGAGSGYLVGGWVAAVVFPTAVVVLTAGAAAVGIRRRRRIAAGR